MDFNMNTASNSELKQECERLDSEYKVLQSEASEKLKRMMELSEQYTKIKELLDKREGRKNNATAR